MGAEPTITGITRGGFVVARDGATDADRKLVRWFPDPAGPEVSAEPSWPDGILQARIDTGEAAGGGVQSVTGTAVDDTDPANPVIDLSGVEFLDSTGLGVMVKALKWAREAGGSLRVVATADRITKVFTITGLDEVMSLSGSVD